jgi:hypothetical protein
MKYYIIMKETFYVLTILVINKGVNKMKLNSKVVQKRIAMIIAIIMIIGMLASSIVPFI